VPIYEYKCENGHVFDVMQKFSDEALTECAECGAAAVRVLHSPAVHFKGSGFHNTDYGHRSKAGAADSNGASEGGDSDSSDSSSGSESSSSLDSGTEGSGSNSSGDSAAMTATAD
jgi:putative FmdB family regulatory protein